MEKQRIEMLIDYLLSSGEKEYIKIASILSKELNGQTQNAYYIKKRMFKLLGDFIDPATFCSLTRADEANTKLINHLYAKTGWSTNRTGMTDINGEERITSEFAYDLENGLRYLHLDRDETGYHIQNQVPTKATGIIVRNSEETFLSENQEVITKIDQTFRLKEYIMSGNYDVAKENAELVELICEYLGYPKVSEPVKELKHTS